MIKTIRFLFLSLAMLGTLSASSPISRPTNEIIGVGGSKVTINIDGSITMLTASGQPIGIYGSDTRFDSGPIDLGAISAPSLSGATDIRIYWDGADLMVSKNGGAYMVWSTAGGGGGLASTDIDTSNELAGILTDESGSGGGFVRATSPTISNLIIPSSSNIQFNSTSGGLAGLKAPAIAGTILITLPSVSSTLLGSTAIGTTVQAYDANLDLWKLTIPPSSFAIGDLLYASAANTLAKLSDVATGNVLLSGGVGTAPSYGKVTTAHTTGIAASGANTDITSVALTGHLTNSFTSLASDPAVYMTGSWFTGGSGTTNFPHVLLQAAGTTASTTWSTAGTALGMNAVTGFTGNFLDFKVAGGASVFKVSSTGAVTMTSDPAFSGALGITGGSIRLFSPAAGVLRVTNSAQTDLDRIQLGGTTSSFPAIKRNGANVEIKDASDANGGGLIINGGTAVTLIKSATATLDFGSTAAQTSAELSITVTGAVDGDDVIVSPPNGSSSANACFTARVSAADTVQVKFNNYSSGAIDPASGTFRVSLIRF